jgi:NADPH-dependent 2,4-dienoyl-CoA reductase/sulfur reductase-like enzyme
MPRLPDPRFAPDCTIELDGRPLPARTGESVAVALLAAGEAIVARSAKYHRPRGPFCLAGSCHACLARVGGVPNQRTCRVACRPGLAVESQNAVPTARRDLLGAIDLAYARGLDVHHLATWSGPANRGAVAFSRQLAGTGRLPSQPPPPTGAAPVEERFDALVVGGGPAGLGAAEALAAAGLRLLLADSDGILGGRLRAGLALPGDPPVGWASEVAQLVARAGGEVACGLTALGLWPDGGGTRALLRVEEEGSRLRLVLAPRLVVATGSCALPPLFPRNDLPGIFAARALARALAEEGLVPGERALVAGEGAEAEAVAGRLASAGMVVRRAAEVLEGHGRRGISWARVGAERVRCDVLAWAGPRAPASELARQAGAAVELEPRSGGYRVLATADGATSASAVRAAGEVTGATSAAEAAAAGRRAGEAARADG